jgi:hypothetical protein
MSCSDEQKAKREAKKYFEKNIVENLKDPSSYKLISISATPISHKTDSYNFLALFESNPERRKFIDSSKVAYDSIYRVSDGGVAYWNVVIKYYANNSYGARLQDTHSLRVYNDPFFVSDMETISEYPSSP